MEDQYLQNIMTSGEAAMLTLQKESYGKYFYHLGPERDSSVFFKIKENKTTIEKCNFILCTGLFDDQKEDLEYSRFVEQNIFLYFQYY